MNGGDGHDNITGGDGRDQLIGGIGDDHLDGGKNNDVLDGGNGNDTLFGGEGSDRMIGGSGHDTLNGGAGLDAYIGGDGDDRFVFESVTDSTMDAMDVIDDFRKGEDCIDVSALQVTFEDFTIQVRDGYTEVVDESTAFAFRLNGEVDIAVDDFSFMS